MVYAKIPIHRGFKIWLRADAITGYICEFDAYTGKEVQGLKRSCCCICLKIDRKNKSPF